MHARQNRVVARLAGWSFAAVWREKRSDRSPPSLLSAAERACDGALFVGGRRALAHCETSAT
jgi:hypothetical protein